MFFFLKCLCHDVHRQQATELNACGWVFSAIYFLKLNWQWRAKWCHSPHYLIIIYYLTVMWYLHLYAYHHKQNRMKIYIYVLIKESQMQIISINLSLIMIILKCTLIYPELNFNSSINDFPSTNICSAQPSLVKATKIQAFNK